MAQLAELVQKSAVQAEQYLNSMPQIGGVNTNVYYSIKHLNGTDDGLEILNKCKPAPGAAAAAAAAATLACKKLIAKTTSWKMMRDELNKITAADAIDFLTIIQFKKVDERFEEVETWSKRQLGVGTSELNVVVVEWLEALRDIAHENRGEKFTGDTIAKKFGIDVNKPIRKYTACSHDRVMQSTMAKNNLVAIAFGIVPSGIAMVGGAMETQLQYSKEEPTPLHSYFENLRSYIERTLEDNGKSIQGTDLNNRNAPPSPNSDAEKIKKALEDLKTAEKKLFTMLFTFKNYVDAIQSGQSHMETDISQGEAQRIVNARNKYLQKVSGLQNQLGAVFRTLLVAVN